MYLDGNAARVRNRDKDDAGKSEKSYLKHELMRRAIRGQVGSFRVSHPKDRIVLIDGNAGDGIGVALPQKDLFVGSKLSTTTPELLTSIATIDGNADVVLCESDPEKISHLKKRFPGCRIIDDHNHVASLIRPFHHKWALWLSDPCGPKDQGIQAMRKVGSILKTDYVITFDEGFVAERLSAVPQSWWAPSARKSYETSQLRYGPMVNPKWWLRQLRMPKMARTHLIHGSPAFRYRLLVLSRYLSEAVRRSPFEVCA